MMRVEKSHELKINGACYDQVIALVLPQSDTLTPISKYFRLTHIAALHSGPTNPSSTSLLATCTAINTL